MGRDAKRNGSPFEAAVTLPALSAVPSKAHGRVTPDELEATWFEAIDPRAATSPPPRARQWWLPLLAITLLSVLVRTLVLRALVPVAIAAGALAVLVRIRRPGGIAGAQGRAQATPDSRRRLQLSAERLEFHARGQAAPQPLLSLDEPFGVTLLAAPRRDRVVLLLTSSEGTFYAGASFDPGARRAFPELLDRASIVGADDPAIAAIGPDGEPFLVAPETLAALISELSRRSPGCTERFFLTDARGAALRLDGRELRAGDRSFDLGAPIEWRAFVFQEAFGQVVALYQGTWVRQGSNEVVLVCLLPAITPAPEGEGVPLSSLDRSALRDLRLMQGAPEDPPPPDQRVAIDRLVMLPIRSALDKAPRPAAQPPRARA